MVVTEELTSIICAMSEQHRFYHFRVLAVDKVVDGDTIYLLVDLGFNVHKREKFRLLDIDTPEIYSGTEEEKARGQEAKQYLIDWLKAAEEDKHELYVYSVKQGKYGRYLAYLYSETPEGEDTRIYNEDVVAAGLAEVY